MNRVKISLEIREAEMLSHAAGQMCDDFADNPKAAGITQSQADAFFKAFEKLNKAIVQAKKIKGETP